MNKFDFFNIVKPYTMTTEDRIFELYNSLEYIRQHEIMGDFVECGVWKGGNILGIMEFLSYHNITNRKIWLYDTFQGMTYPEDIDIDYNGKKATEIYNEILCFSPIDEVKQTLSKSNYPQDLVNFVVGDVCNTLDLNENLPTQIALLRLDTDWYQSTLKEMNILFPLVEKNGVLIVDDYGHWRGAKQAVDEYLQSNNLNLTIKHIDYTGIKIIKNN